MDGGPSHDGRARESRNRVAQFASAVSLDADSLDPDCVRQTRGYHQISLKRYAPAFVLIHTFDTQRRDRSIRGVACATNDRVQRMPGPIDVPTIFRVFVRISRNNRYPCYGFLQEREESSVTIFRVLQC